jgi:carbon storage regulator CsrA
MLVSCQKPTAKGVGCSDANTYEPFAPRAPTPFALNIRSNPVRISDPAIQVFQLKEERTMLVLTQKVGEAIRIGDDIVLTVLEVAGRQVRLGIDAPRHLPILRAEILDREPASPALLPLESGKLRQETTALNE